MLSVDPRLRGKEGENHSHLHLFFNTSLLPWNYVPSTSYFAPLHYLIEYDILEESGRSMLGIIHAEINSLKYEFM